MVILFRHILGVVSISRSPDCFLIPHGTHPPARKMFRPMYGNPPSYTWAARPRYKMAGCQMCSGENSVPTWPFHCFDKSILTIGRSPELTAVTPRPSVKNTPDGSILESRAPTTPVALRPVSASHAPAIVSAPGVQFRKDCWLSQKPSFDRRLWAYKKFFRNWAPGNGAAGATNQPGLPHAKGQWRGGLILAGTESGVVFASSTGQANIGGSPSSFLHAIIGIDLSRGSDIYGNSDTVMPASVNLPVCFYLGRPA